MPQRALESAKEAVQAAIDEAVAMPQRALESIREALHQQAAAEAKTSARGHLPPSPLTPRLHVSSDTNSTNLLKRPTSQADFLRVSLCAVAIDPLKTDPQNT